MLRTVDTAPPALAELATPITAEPDTPVVPTVPEVALCESPFPAAGVELSTFTLVSPLT